ncbi:MAG: hypothetical protein ACLTE2_04330 [Eubacteriales bacterium]
MDLLQTCKQEKTSLFYPEEVIFMKIAVVCANGKAGTRIVNEAVTEKT